MTQCGMLNPKLHTTTPEIAMISKIRCWSLMASIGLSCYLKEMGRYQSPLELVPTHVEQLIGKGKPFFFRLIACNSIDEHSKARFGYYVSYGIAHLHAHEPYICS